MRRILAAAPLLGLAWLSVPEALAGPAAAGAAPETRASAGPADAEVLQRIRDSFLFVGGGSGVLISADGYALTNFHVICIAPPGEIGVQRTNGDWLKAQVVGCDPEGDLALLKVEGRTPFPFSSFRSSRAVRAGEACWAVGNPFSLGNVNADPTISKGIVCCPEIFLGSGYTNVILTDAAINPGNSGGPLFDAEGRLIGINGRIQSRFGTRFNTGAGYSIGSDFVQAALPRLRACQGGYFMHVRAPEFDFRLPHPEVPSFPPAEVVVSRVLPGSAAERAGFRPGDRLTAVEGKPVTLPAQFLAELGMAAPGKELRIGVRRGEPAEALEIPFRLEARHRTQWPFDIQDLKLDLGARFGEAKDEKALEVLEVVPRGPAETAGLRKGDRVAAGWRVERDLASGRAELKSLALDAAVLNDGLPVGMRYPVPGVRLDVKRAAPQGGPGGKEPPAPVPPPVSPLDEEGPGETEEPPPEPAKLAPPPAEGAVSIPLQLGDPVLSLPYQRSLGFTVEETSAGLVVGEVEPGGLGAEAGLSPKARIVAVNAAAVRSHVELLSQIAKAKPGEAVRIEVSGPPGAAPRTVEIARRHY